MKIMFWRKKSVIQTKAQFLQTTIPLFILKLRSFDTPSKTLILLQDIELHNLYQYFPWCGWQNNLLKIYQKCQFSKQESAVLHRFVPDRAFFSDNLIAFYSDFMGAITDVILIQLLN